MDPVRINKYLAARFNFGRREADELVSKGQVTINGELARPGGRVFEGDLVEVKGEKTSPKAKLTYLLMDKPVGYVCSRRQQGDTPTIYSLLPKQYQHLKTVGRLDKDSSGLIMLTNDGELAHRLTHPSFKKVKKYHLEIDKPLQPLHRQMISDFGIDLPDGKSKLGLTRISDSDLTWEVTMHEGRNRQIRRTFASLGYNVIKLRRISFSDYSLSQLESKLFLEITI